MSWCSFEPNKSKLQTMTTKTGTFKGSYCNSHQVLIDACKKGDQKAQFKIYKLYYKSMYNESLRIVNDTMEAEDIIQESFLSAFEEINNYSGTVSFGAWLKRIVRNRSLDILRKNRKITFENIESIHGMEDNYTESSCLNEEPDRKMKRVIEIIKHLPIKCRNIFSLYFLEGYDHEEIAEILSISGSTSRSQLSRARSKVISEYIIKDKLY
jgi:RNA polymerase sigma-70 factor (ECF subfamily)